MVYLKACKDIVENGFSIFRRLWLFLSRCQDNIPVYMSCQYCLDILVGMPCLPSY